MTKVERNRFLKPRSTMLREFSKNLKNLYEYGVYSYQECIEHRGSMFKCVNRKKKK